MASSISQSQLEDSIDSSRFSEIKQIEIEHDPQKALLRIRKDYAALQAQYEEAMTYVQQMDDIHRQLGELTKENTKLKSEKDEVERRLQIALQVNEELNSKLQIQRAQFPIQQQGQINPNLKLLYEQEKIKSDEQIQKLNQSLSEAEKSIQDQKSETEKVKGNLKQIFDAAKNKFNKDFNSTQELVDFFNSSNIQSETENASSLSTSILSQTGNQTEELESKIKNYRQKYNEERRTNKQLQKTLKKISKKHHSLSKSQEYEVDNLNDKVTDLQNTIKKTQTDYDKKLKEKQTENEKITIELQTAKLKIDELNKQIQQQKQKYQFQLDLQQKKQEQQQQLNEVTKNDITSQTVINQYKESISELNSKLDAQTVKTKEISKLYILLKKQYVQLNKRFEINKKEKSDILLKYQTNETENTKIINENNSLKEEIKKLQFEKDSLEMQSVSNDSTKKADQIKLDKTNAKVDELLLQIEKFKTERSVFQSLLDMQKKEISSIYRERDNIFNVIRKQNSLIKQCENQINNLSHEKKDLIRQVDYLTSNKNSNFMNSQFESMMNATNPSQNFNGIQSPSQNFNSIQNPSQNFNGIQSPPQNFDQLLNQIQKSNQSNLNQSIPLTAWTSSELPTNLVQPILEIGKKENMKVTDKIQKVINTISQYYNSELADKDESLKALSSSSENCEKLFQQFADSICNLIGEKKTKATQMNQQTIITRIGQIIKENSTMLDDITKFDNSIQALFKKLNVNSFSEATQEIENIFRAIQKVDGKLKKQKNINRKLVEIIDAAQNESFEKQTELESIIEEQKKLNEYSNIEKDSLSQENNELKTKCKALEEDFETFKSYSEETIEEMKSNNDKKMNEIKEKYQKEQENLLSEIIEKDNNIKELREVYRKSENSLEKCLKTTVILKNNCNSQQEKIKQLQSNFSDMQRQYKEKLTKEKENFTQILNKTIEQYKNKNESLRILLDKATAALSESDMKNHDLAAANNQLNLDKQQLLARIETQKQEIEREKQLSESKLKAMQLAVDVQNQSAIETETAKFDREKRQIYTDIANSFKQFYDARQKLDEVALKNLLEKVSQELNRLIYQEASLKTLLGVKQGDRLEDAVSKLFMTVYNVNK